MTSDLYAVVEHRQWSGPDEGGVHFRSYRSDAVELAAELTAEERGKPRPSRFVVYRMELVEEDEN